MDDENYRLHPDTCHGCYDISMYPVLHLAYIQIRIDDSQTIRRRLPPTTLSGGFFDAKQFRSPAYTLYTVFGIVAFLGLFTG